MHEPSPHGQAFEPTWLTTSSFSVEVEDRSVPTVLWTPTDGPARGLILIGHGASGTKTEGYVVALARGLVRRARVAVCAIDGPVHGDRREDGAVTGVVPFLEFSQRWANDHHLTDEAVADWRGVLDHILGVLGDPELPVGYWGVSMGTILGLPFVAAEPRIGAAVLGLMGLTGPTKHRLERDAAALTCPIEFLVQWDDQLFDRHLAFKLFEAISSDDKHLVANPGAHGDVPTRTFRASADFLISALGLAAAP